MGPSWSSEALFDPWGAGEGGGPEREGPPDGDGDDEAEGVKAGEDEPAAPANGDAPPPDPASDPSGFLRHQAVPLLQGLVDRLELFGHNGSIQDLLDLRGRPSLRLLAWPRTGLMEGPERRRATLELDVLRGETPTVRVRWWRGTNPDRVSHLADLPAHAVDVEWLRGRVLDGLHHILREE